MKRLIFYTFATLLLALTAFPSNGQDSGEDKTERETFVGPPPVVGSWKFQSSRYRADSCVMSGNMYIRQTSSANVFKCSFTAIEDCDGQDKWVVEQTCEATLGDGRLGIKSEIVNFLQAKEFTASYAPDHFALTVDNRELMTGSLVSAVVAPVEFRRQADNLS